MKSEFDPSTPETPSPKKSSVTLEFRLSLWLKIAILASVVALAAVGYVASQWSTRQQLKNGRIEPDDPEDIAQRKVLQDFILTEENGTTKKLSDFRGNVVILSFWASWCGPCLSELPTFAAIDNKFHARGVRVVPVNVDDGNAGRDFAKDFWPKKQIGFPTYYDVKKDLANLFEVDMLPSTFVIDRQGRLVFSSAGASDWSSKDTQDLIEAVLREPSS